MSEKGFSINNTENFLLKQKNSKKVVAIFTAVNNNCIRYISFIISFVVEETVFEVRILSGNFKKPSNFDSLSTTISTCFLKLSCDFILIPRFFYNVDTLDRMAINKIFVFDFFPNSMNTVFSDIKAKLVTIQPVMNAFEFFGQLCYGTFFINDHNRSIICLKSNFEFVTFFWQTIRKVVYIKKEQQ